MAGTLRDIRELEAEIEAAGLRGITKQQILDALKSQAKVGGCMSINGGTTPITIAGGWNRIDTWDRSIDTHGVKDGLTDATDPGGWYRISNAASGDYTVTGSIRFTATSAGTYEMRVAIVQEDLIVKTTPYRDAVTITAGGGGVLSIVGGVIKDVARNERVQLEIKGVNNSQVTITHGQFGVQR